MKKLAFLASMLASAAPTHAAPLPDPIAPAATGQLQCYSPDTTRKTCQSLASYKNGTNGTIDNTGVVLISKSPVITMETVSTVEIKAGQVCGKIREQDIDEARFSAGGHPLDMGQTELLRRQQKVVLKGVFNHEICTAYVADGKTLIVKVSMDAVPMPVPEQRVIWVSANEGYKVSP